MSSIYGNLLSNLCVKDAFSREVPISSADPLDVLCALEDMEEDERTEMYEILFTKH